MSETPAPAPPPHRLVHWISAADSIYGIDMLDCRGFIATMLSTSSVESAQSFVRLRSSTGEEHRGRDPADSVETPCLLEYPHEGPIRDGVLCKAQAMEDKWDVYLHDGWLEFARSWTGELSFKASLEPYLNLVRVKHVRHSDPPPGGANGRLAVAIVDFLIKSHLYDLAAPHPLLKGLTPDQEVLLSFHLFGRRGVYGTRADVTGHRVERREGGGCRIVVPGA